MLSFGMWDCDAFLDRYVIDVRKIAGVDKVRPEGVIRSAEAICMVRGLVFSTWFQYISRKNYSFKMLLSKAVFLNRWVRPPLGSPNLLIDRQNQIYSSIWVTKFCFALKSGSPLSKCCKQLMYLKCGPKCFIFFVWPADENNCSPLG